MVATSGSPQYNIPEILAENGDPWMCFPPVLMLTMYSPGDIGKYDTLVTPLDFSFFVISALDGPSTLMSRLSV